MKVAFTTIWIAVLFFIFFMFFGWFRNIYKLTQCDFEAPYKAEIIHGIGVVPAVGAVTGWMDFGK